VNVPRLAPRNYLLSLVVSDNIYEFPVVSINKIYPSTKEDVCHLQ